jgi:hypothetical protein
LEQFSIPFDLWQQGAGRLILAKREDGIFAAGVGGVIISIPRQVGKTYMIGWIVFALCTLVPGLTVIWTAHHTRTSNETFAKMSAMAKRAKVVPYIEDVRRANGEQAILFKNESRILFGARDMGFGLGFDMVDVLVLDEGQRVKEVAMADMVPATNAAPNGLVIMMGTPPRPTDNGDVFAARRKDALDGDPDTLYLELSADPGAKIIDWDQVAKANPSFPHRTSKTAILRMQKLLGSDEGFYREGYGIWDDADASKSKIPSTVWSGTVAPEGVDIADPVVAVDVRTGLAQSLAITISGICVVDGDERDVVDVARYELGINEVWARTYVVDEARKILDRLGLDWVVVDGFGEGNGPLIPMLEEAGIRVVKLGTVDMRSGAAGLVDGFINGRILHMPESAPFPLAVAVAGAGFRSSNEGFLWSQSRSEVDITALRSVTAGWWVLHSTRADRYDIRDSIMGGRS